MVTYKPFNQVAAIDDLHRKLGMSLSSEADLGNLILSTINHKQSA